MRTETVGRNLLYQEAKVVDTVTGCTLTVGETGEFCFRGYHVMQGYYGEIFMAWIKLQSGITATAVENQVSCRDEIAHYKIPKYVWVVDEFTMTVTGKLQKFPMRKIAREKMPAASRS